METKPRGYRNTSASETVPTSSVSPPFKVWDGHMVQAIRLFDDGKWHFPSEAGRKAFESYGHTTCLLAFKLWQEDYRQTKAVVFVRTTEGMTNALPDWVDLDDYDLCEDQGLAMVEMGWWINYGHVKPLNK